MAALATGPMTGLALRSLRHRRSAFTATFLAVLLGTALIGSFATLVETASGPVPDADAETLMTMGAVVGGWGALIGLYAVASTVGLTVGQRAVEVGLLRTVGATPRQVRRLVRAETLVVALVAAVLGALLALSTGRLLLRALVEGDLVTDVPYGGGPLSLSIVVAGMLLVCALAAGLAGRRATRGPATVVPADAQRMGSRLPWWRGAAAVLLIGYGLAMGVVTVTVTADSDDPYHAMATSGSSSILVGVGMALLAPALLRVAARVARPLLERRLPEGHLAAYHASRRADLLGGVLGPVVVLTAAAAGTLMLVGIDHRTLLAPVEGGETVNLLNNVVVGMISLFAAIMVVNAFAALLAHRRAELNRLRLLGAGRRQVERMVLTEAALVAATGVGAGLVASLATVVPFGLAREEGIVPDGQLWLPPLVAAGVALLTLVAAGTAVRRIVRTPALAR